INGGGLAIFDAEPRITNSLIAGNTASNYGGGIFSAHSTATMINTTIAGNQAGRFGGLAVSPSEKPTLRNTVIYGNSSGIPHSFPIEVDDIMHSLVQDRDLEGTNGNLNGNDPDLTPELVFLSPQAPGLSNGGNYRLAPNSPAINAGNNGFFPGDVADDRDLAGENRFRGASIDMGAFESTDLRLIELGDVADITVPFGTALADMPLPDAFVVQGTLDDASTVNINLSRDATQWTLLEPVEGSYDAHTAGTYLFAVDLTIDADVFANPDALKAQVTVIVEKGVPVITTDAVQTHVYDGTVKNILASLNHDEATLAYSPQQGYTDAGTYEITVAAEETANYGAVSAVVTLQIDPAEVTGIRLEDASFAYDGTAKSVEISGTLPEGASVAYAINGLPGNEATDAGTYEVTASIGGDNYETLELTAELVITPRDVHVTAADAAKVYGEADPTFTYSYTPALAEGDAFTGAL